MYQSRKLYLMLALTAAACTDHDPVAPPLASPELDPSAGVSANARQAVDAMAEPFRHRLAIELSVDGLLAPNATISLSVKGTATEKLTGGEVRLMLPTFAAMQHNGTDNPSYPVEKDIPATASWKLPRMDAGGTWTRSTNLSLPGDGYYQVAVLVTANAPDGEDSPLVIGQYDLERWLLVVDGGGTVTYFLDPDSMPEGVVEGEGPFRRKRRPSNTTGASAYANADSDDEISFHAVYYQGGRRKNAKDTELRIEYKDQSDETVRSHKVTVPSNGIVTADCPDAYEYLVATLIVPNTAETIGRYVVSGTEVYNSDCGTTRTLLASSYQFLPWLHLNEVIPEIEDHFDQHRVAIKWAFHYRNEYTYYWRKSDRVTFGYTYYGNKWVAAHEFSHGLHHIAMGGITGEDDCSDHEISKPSSYQCAFSEGFADYAASVGTGSPSDWESRHYTKSGHDEAEIEGNVTALFHDLIDGVKDGNDDTSYPADFIADVFETCRASGRKRDDTTDFVWCMENRVNSTVHNSHFPRGPSAPSRVSRTATNPRGWSADKIRETWKQNIS